MTRLEILNYLQQIEYLNFNKEFCEETMYDQLESVLMHAKQENCFPCIFSIDSGISKAVLLIKGLSDVIKIPYQCRYDGERYDEDYTDYEDALEIAIAGGEETLRAFHNNCREPNPADYYTPHECATEYYETQSGEEHWDYCKFETEIYEAACEDGLEIYFAEERLLGYIGDNYPVYYQVRCTPMDEMNIDYNSPKAEQKKETSKNICKTHHCDCFNPIWIADFIEMYGEEEFLRLNQFLCDHDIQDLRESNIGYLDGAPILFDYTGYREW